MEFKTPIRPLSNEQFHSLRERISKESPSLYRKHILTDPIESKYRNFDNVDNVEVGIGKKNKFDGAKSKHSQFNNVKINRDIFDSNVNKNVYNGSINSNGFLSGSRSQDQFKSQELTQEELAGNLNSTKNDISFMEEFASGEDKIIGNYENPVLSKLSERTINKEVELQNIIINVLFIFVLNLIKKSVILLIYYSTMGQNLNNLVSNYFWSMKKNTFYKRGIYFIFDNSDYIFAWLETAIISIIAINTVLTIWKFMKKTSTDDLHLSKKQKTLLGLDDHINKINYSMTNPKNKPHFVSGNKAFNNNTVSMDKTDKISGMINGNVGIEVNQSTPYLFKSLETPLKLKDQQKQMQSLQPQSAISNKFTTAFNHNNSTDLRRNILNRNVFMGNIPSAVHDNKNTNKTQASHSLGYTPSNKYVYLMDSPSPRKRI